MYVSTFYSFKGGVGRTMALVNAAVWLAKKGNTVLLVDFDLEAPGLDTFPLLTSKADSLGLVDFVSRFLKTDQAPDVKDYIARCSRVENLSVMPSGRYSANYAQNFTEIDWRMLYEERDGFLLMEDLKEQWRQTIRPDYVLIDSRTGYTDTGGICTRQLPDSVVILFFPNEQNLRGLRKVVADIRSESDLPRKKNIELHFVMSNVPDLDDEDDILMAIKQRFQTELDIVHEPTVIHRYESLSLLNQTVFAEQRPKSRLAREYLDLAEQVVDRNLQDRDAALRFLRQTRSSVEGYRFRLGQSPKTQGEKLTEIEDFHSDDSEVMFHLGNLAAKSGRLEDAKSFLDRCIDLGYEHADAYVERARIHDRNEHTEDAQTDAMAALMQTTVPLHLVMQAIRLLGEDSDCEIAELPAVRSLDVDDRLAFASDLVRIRPNKHAETILQHIIDDHEQSSELRDDARSKLTLNYIRAGRYDHAIQLLTSGGREVQSTSIADTFNFAMAKWAQSGAIPKPLFKSVVTLDESTDEERKDANYLQCLALAYWAIGDHTKATQFADTAQDIGQTKRMVFSCWRYQEVPGRVFAADVAELQKMINGEVTQEPRFMKRNSTATEQA